MRGMERVPNVTAQAHSRHSRRAASWVLSRTRAPLGAGDDAYDLAADTSELLGNPVLGPLIRSALRLVAPELDPAEATPPLARDPLTGLPTLVPLPRLERLYFQCARPLTAPTRLGCV